MDKFKRGMVFNQLSAESIIGMDGPHFVTWSTRNYRRPGVVKMFAMELARVIVVMTRSRLYVHLVWSGSLVSPVLDIPWNSPHMDSVEYTVKNNSKLKLSAEMSYFSCAQERGRVSLSLRTRLAVQIAQYIQQYKDELSTTRLSQQNGQNSSVQTKPLSNPNVPQQQVNGSISGVPSSPAESTVRTQTENTYSSPVPERSPQRTGFHHSLVNTSDASSSTAQPSPQSSQPVTTQAPLPPEPFTESVFNEERSLPSSSFSRRVVSHLPDSNLHYESKRPAPVRSLSDFTSSIDSGLHTVSLGMRVQQNYQAPHLMAAGPDTAYQLLVGQDVVVSDLNIDCTVDKGSAGAGAFTVRGCNLYVTRTQVIAVDTGTGQYFVHLTLPLPANATARVDDRELLCIEFEGQELSPQTRQQTAVVHGKSVVRFKCTDPRRIHSSICMT